MSLLFTNEFRTALDNAFLNGLADNGLNRASLPPGVSIANLIASVTSDGLGNLTSTSNFTVGQNLTVTGTFNVGALTTQGLTLNAGSVPASTSTTGVLGLTSDNHKIQASVNTSIPAILFNPDVKNSVFAERYVHPNGNDTNSGVDWENAYATVYGALKACVAAGGTALGVARIYVADGSYCNPDHSTGIWLTTDSAVYTGSNQWVNSSTLRFEMIGIGGRGTQFSFGGQAQVVGAAGVPALKLYGANGLSFKNIIFYDRTELNVDPITGLPHGDFTHGPTKIRFDDCSFETSITTVNGFAACHPSFLAGASFWIYIRDCHFFAQGALGGGGITVGGYIANVSTNTVTLSYQDDMYTHNANGLKVSVGGQTRTIVSTNFGAGTITFDGPGGLAIGNTINRIAIQGDPIATNGINGAVVTLATAGNAAYYQPGDFIRDYATGAFVYQVLSVNVGANQLTFTAPVNSWTTSTLLLFQVSENRGQPLRSSVFLTPDVPGTGISGGYLYFIEHCTAGGGGLTYYNGAQEWDFFVNDFNVESDFLHPTGPGVHLRLYGNYGFAQVSWSGNADDIQDHNGVFFPDVQIDGINGFVPNPSIVNVDHCSGVTGPCVVGTQYFPLVQLQPSSQGQSGFLFGKVYGQTDAGRRLAGNRFQNLALNNTADFPAAINPATVTSGIADPFGGTRAFRVTQAGTNNINATVYSNTGAVGSGEIVFAGCWCRASGGQPLIVLRQGVATNNTFARPSGGDGEWQWCSGYMLGIASASDTVTVTVTTFNIAAASTDYYGMVVYRFPAGTLSVTELAEFQQHCGPFPSNTPAGVFAPMLDLGLSKHIVTFQESPQANTHPSIAAGTNLGTSPTVSVVGTDTCGTISVTTGTGSSSGLLATVTFAVAYAAAPHVKIQATNAAAAALLQTYPTKTASTFLLNTLNALVDATTYTWDYLVVG
jgi:hypothetical protein